MGDWKPKSWKPVAPEPVRSEVDPIYVEGKGPPGGEWKPKSWKPAEPEADLIDVLKDHGKTAAYAAGTGGSFGLAPVLSGAMGAVDELGRRAGLGAPIADENLAIWDAVKARFKEERGDYIEERERAYKAHPNTALAAELASALVVPIPGAGAFNLAKGAGGVAARIGTNAAVGSGLGVVSETGEENPDYLNGALTGGAIGVVGGAGGEILKKGGSALRGWAQGGIERAKASAQEIAENLGLKGVSSAGGSLGGNAGAVLNLITKAKAALDDPMATAAAKAKAQELLDNPEVIRAAQRAYENAMDHGGQKISEMLSSEEALEAALKSNAPEAIAAAAEESLVSPIKKHVIPQVVKYATRMSLPFVGQYVGGEIGGDAGQIIGGLAGAGAGIAAGKPGTAAANAIKKPGVRKAGWEVIKGVLGVTPEKLGQFAPVLTRAMAAGPMQFAVDYFVLNQQNPEAREKFKLIEDENEASAEPADQ